MHSSHTHHRAPRAAYFCAAAAVNLISGALIICATKFNFFGRVEQVRSRAAFLSFTRITKITVHEMNQPQIP